MKVEHSGLVEQADLDALGAWDAMRGFLAAASLAESLAGTQVIAASRAAEPFLGVSSSREYCEAVVLRRAAWRLLAKQGRLVRPPSGGS